MLLLHPADATAPADARPRYLEVYYGAAEDRSSRKDMQASTAHHLALREQPGLQEGA